MPIRNLIAQLVSALDESKTLRLVEVHVENDVIRFMLEEHSGPHRTVEVPSTEPISVDQWLKNNGSP